MVLSMHAYLNGFRLTFGDNGDIIVIIKSRYLFFCVGNRPDLTPSNGMHSKDKEDTITKQRQRLFLPLAAPVLNPRTGRREELSVIQLQRGSYNQQLTLCIGTGNMWGKAHVKKKKKGLQCHTVDLLLTAQKKRKWVKTLHATCSRKSKRGEMG